MCKKRGENFSLEITPCTWKCKWIPGNCPHWNITKERKPEDNFDYEIYWQAAKLAKICNFEEPLGYSKSINESIKLLIDIENN